MLRKKEGKIFILLMVLLSTLNLNAQEHDHDAHDHTHHHNNEISLATGIVPLDEDGETEITVGFHLHYIRGIGKSKRFGIGIAAETIIDEHKHYTFSVVFQYRVYKGLILGYSPGLVIRKHGSDLKYLFGNHFEMTYEFEIGKFHIGPLVEIAAESNEKHYMGGIHFGVEF